MGEWSSLVYNNKVNSEKKEKKEGRRRCVRYVHQNRPSISSKLQDPLWWVALCLPLKNLKDKAAEQLKININYQ
jgi:hypothetical protein